MQTRAIKIIACLIGLIATSFVGVGFAVHSARPNYGRCDFFTKELNGGKKKFGGATYDAKLCGADVKNGFEVRLQIFDDAGVLLAQRYFSYYINSASERDLVDGADAIIYYDNSSANVMQSVPIPPTKWDWIRARLPLF
ncbi:hypothetical protein [Burkholderia ubonensis]|uniref:hypothetical protein n=1 Tax=Burkholderia ubonensis TaxID=101571 RepID=UPI0012FBBEC0|nr:hypothetical protein [Burkholderia ubonensis]